MNEDPGMLIAALREDNDKLMLTNEQQARLIEQLQARQRELAAQIGRQTNLLVGIFNVLKAFMVEQ